MNLHSLCLLLGFPESDMTEATSMHAQASCSVAKSCPTRLQLQGLQPTRLLCPWDSPGKNTRVGCPVLLQGIFLTQRWNPCLLPWQADSLAQATWEAHSLGKFCANFLSFIFQISNTYLFICVLLCSIA